MNRTWLIICLCLSSFMLTQLKSQELKSLGLFFKAEKQLRLENFKKARTSLNLADLELLELWESMLTGRSRPLSQWMKERYQDMGLKHLFTPSGFHLTAVLAPFLRISHSKRYQLTILAIIGTLLYFIPGFAALKRMILVKGNQKVFGQQAGFALAMILDVLIGSFQSNTLSFTYSFLFLSIVYSGSKGIGLAFWFFFGQCLLAYFNGQEISPLLLVLSPILTFGFGCSLPLLFILAIPLWDWQLKIGLMILKLLQSLVDCAFYIVSNTPFWEIHIGVLLLLTLFTLRRWKLFILIFVFLSNNLNTDHSRVSFGSSYEFRPQGKILKVVNREKLDWVYFEDGKCQRQLVRGFWWEKCSPKRKSTRKNL